MAVSARPLRRRQILTRLPNECLPCLQPCHLRPDTASRRRERTGVGDNQGMSLNPPSQYQTAANLRARQRLWEYQRQPFDLVAWVFDLVDIGAGSRRRGFSMSGAATGSIRLGFIPSGSMRLVVISRPGCSRQQRDRWKVKSTW